MSIKQKIGPYTAENRAFSKMGLKLQKIFKALGGRIARLPS